MLPHSKIDFDAMSKSCILGEMPVFPSYCVLGGMSLGAGIFGQPFGHSVIT